MARIRFGGNVVEFSPRQVWSLLFVSLFLLSLTYFMSNIEPNYEELANLEEKDIEKLGRFPESNPVVEVKGYKFDSKLKKVDLNLIPIKDTEATGIAQDVKKKEVDAISPWPKDIAKSWRQEDYLARAAGHNVVAMAMDAIEGQRDYIREVQRNLIRTQNRAPDSRYNINVTLSDHLSLDRPIPDTRPPICQHFVYDHNDLPTATVIIPFYNEALTMLLRTIHSLLNRTPDQLLDKIILVDDKSTDPWLGDNLVRYLNLLPKVELVRNEKRVGLIVSRMKGARLAESPVIIFLDAHTEANEGWILPLLDEIHRHPNAVYQPYVDAIDTMTLAYGHGGSYHKGSFSWDLRYTWLKVADHEQQAALEAGHPFFSPTLVGCAIAVQREYFFHIGAFDEGLKIWGGENTELGFRVWQCGGKVTTVTCSRVGHVFKEFPYKFDGDKEETVQKNLIRVAETWMDGMRKYFYASTRVFEFKRAELNAEELASLEERKALRKNLKCKNFEWYMYNVIPEVDIPPSDATFYGEIMNLHTKACWEISEDYFVGMTYICYGHKIIPKNNFALTKDGLLRYRDKCVKASPPYPALKLSECPKAEDKETHGVWEVIKQGHVHGQLQFRWRNEKGVLEFFCLVQVTNVLREHYHDQMPQLSTCDKDNIYQTWGFTYYFDWDRVPKEILAI